MRGNHRHWSDDQKRRMHDMRAAGSHFSEIAAFFGCSAPCIKRIVEPASADEIAAAKARRKVKDMARIERVTAAAEEPPVRRPREPQDTRHLTGRLLGDPLPGRSALDARPKDPSENLWR